MLPLLCTFLAAHAHRAPFTDVRWPAASAHPEVRIGRRWAPLLAVDGVPTDALLDLAKKHYGAGWLWAFERRLPDLLTLAGQPPLETVSLTIDRRGAHTLEGVPLTDDNFQRLLQTDDADIETWRPQIGTLRRAPFARLRFDGEQPEVTLDGAWVPLVAIDGLPTAEIMETAAALYGEARFKRFGEDLEDLLAEMDFYLGSTVRLTLRTADGLVTREAAMTRDNRAAVWEANQPEEPPVVLTRQQALRDIDHLIDLLQTRYAYLHRTGADLEAAFAEAREQLPETLTAEALSLVLSEAVAVLGDGHSGIDARRAMARGYLPFLVQQSAAGPVAFLDDRTGFLDEAHPILLGIDGLPLSVWMEAAGATIPPGSPQLEEHWSHRRMRFLNHLRGDLGLPLTETLTVTLASLDGDTVERTLPVSEARPIYGVWPRAETGWLEGDVGYLRIPSMSSDTEAVAEAMVEFADAHGLIIDVRGNRGGSRAILRVVLPWLIEAPVVVNVAAARWTGDLRVDDLSNRYLVTPDDLWLSDAERALLLEFGETFTPSLDPLPGSGPWHYMVVSPRSDGRRLAGPVVVLQDEPCFSATDIFLGGMATQPAVTRVGTPSGGGSARAKSHTLPESELTVRLATIASFRPDGRLYDGLGIEPDVLVAPEPGDLIGRGDAVLQAGLDALWAAIEDAAQP